MKATSIQVLTIDFWNTLYQLQGTAGSRDAIRHERLLQLARTLNLGDDEMAKSVFRVIDGFIKERWSRGFRSTDDDVASHLVSRFNCLTAAHAKVLLEGIDEIHRTVLKPIPLPGAAEFLDWAGARFPIYLISDTYTIRGRVIDAVLRDDGLLKNFKATFYSDLLGVEKPDTTAMKLILTTEGVIPDNVLHIGDLEDRDAEMCRRAGCHCFLIDGSSAAVSFAKVRQLIGN